jgi:hypothetical protein
VLDAAGKLDAAKRAEEEKREREAEQWKREMLDTIKRIELNSRQRGH